MNYEIRKIKKFQNGNNEVVKVDIDATAEDGAKFTFYNMELIPAGTNKKGEAFDAFISAPSYKGKDGNYYHNYYVGLPKETNAELVKKIYEKLNAPQETEAVEFPFN